MILHSAHANVCKMRVYCIVSKILSPQFVGEMKGKVGATAERGLELVSKMIDCGDLLSYKTFAKHIIIRDKVIHPVDA